jgi:4-hydroxy-tetrahydrodipicolinate synthase
MSGQYTVSAGAAVAAWYSSIVTGLHGVHAAAITPRGKNGELDFGAAFELIDHLCRGGVNGILLFGPHGEYPAFSPEERARLVKLGVKRSRVPVLAGVGAATLDVSVDLAREARDADAAALVLPPPHFFHYDQDDLHAYFSQFAAEAGNDPPLLIWRTESLAVETAIALCDGGRFAAVIDATGDGDSIQRLAAAGVTVLSGHDRAAARPERAGVISAAACAVPELLVALDRALAAGAAEDVEGLQHRLQEFVRWAARFPEPAGVKLATGLRGLKTGPLAVPLSPQKQKDLDAFRAWFQAWLPAVGKLPANA